MSTVGATHITFSLLLLSSFILQIEREALMTQKTSNIYRKADLILDDQPYKHSHELSYD